MSTDDKSPSDDIQATSTPSESQCVEPTEERGDVTERAAGVERARYADIANAIDDATADGMFPLIAFGLDKDNRPPQALLVTSSIPDMVLAWDMLDRFLPQDYAFSGYVPWSRLETFADSHRMIVRKHEINIPNFVAVRDAEFFINLARDHSASRWHQKAFGLVDICGFSKTTIEQQLAYRTSLALALSQASARVHKLHEAEYLPGRSAFHSTSTGDGFYFWHRWPGGANDVAVFMLLLYVMVQTEAMRVTRRSTMRLRGAFGIGEAYTFPFHDLGSRWSREPVGQDAIGPVLNGLARLLKDSDPGQILIADFERPGRPTQIPRLRRQNSLNRLNANYFRLSLVRRIR